MTQPNPPDQLVQLKGLLRQVLGARLRDLSVTLHEGRVLLRGTAVSYHVKQLAQHLALRALGNAALVNELDVLRPVPESGSGNDWDAGP
jgi:osmotically-inducible protein OsmY